MRDLIDLVSKEHLSEDAHAANLDDFTRAYLEAMFWTEHEELEGKDTDDLAPDALADIKQECEAFEREAGPETIAAYGPREAGHDFWLTRNGHGAGFWECDHCDKPTGDRLTELSDKFGPVDVYVGDDGLVY